MVVTILSKFISHIIERNSIIFSVNTGMYNCYLISVVYEKLNKIKFNDSITQPKFNLI